MRLELEARTKLDLPRARQCIRDHTGAADAAGRCEDVALAWDREVRPVGNVEDFAAQLQAAAIAEGEALVDCAVDGDESGTDQSVAAEIAVVSPATGSENAVGSKYCTGPPLMGLELRPGTRSGRSGEGPVPKRARALS